MAWIDMKELLQDEYEEELRYRYSWPNFDWKKQWKYCPTCKSPYVECPLCGNNCCNGGSGTIDGEQCFVCDLAYDEQDRVFGLIPEELRKHIYFIPDPKSLIEDKEILTTHDNMLGQFYHDLDEVIDKFC